MAVARIAPHVVRATLFNRRVLTGPHTLTRSTSWSTRPLALCRAFSSPSAADLQPQAASSGEVMPSSGGSALGDLAQRSSLLPKPEVFDERLKPGFRGGRALLVFFLCNAIPFTGFLYYLREQRDERAQMSLSVLPLSAGDVITEALRVMRTASTCFFQQHGDKSGDVLLVDPHLPEASAYAAPTEPLPLLPQLERNALTDILEAPSSPGLGFVHFALSRNSSAGKALLAGDRQAHLMYLSGTRGAYCTVSGQLSVLSDPESRRRYWKTFWSFSFPVFTEPAKPAVPSTTGQTPEPVEAPPAWSAKDYMLVRLAVTEVSLHAMVDGPQRWQGRRVRRSENTNAKDAEAEWFLVAPE